MKACVFDGSLRVAENHPEPRRRNGEVLIRVDLAGICRTDLEIVKGYMNFTGILGHEFVGTVVDGKNAGQRVVGDINCVCGRCEMCQAGLRSHCPNRTVLGIKGHDGAMAQYLALPEVNLQSVPDNVSDEQAVFVEPLAAAFQVMRQHAFDKRQKVVVLGDGRLGQLVAQVLQAAGYSPVVIGKHPNKLEVLDKRGISSQLLDEGRSRKDAHVVVECTGKAEGMTTAMEFVRPQGTIILKSTIADSSGINLSPLVVNEVKVLGSRCGPFPDALVALGAGEVEVTGMITATYSLGEAVAAFAKATEPESLKILIKP